MAAFIFVVVVIAVGVGVGVDIGVIFSSHATKMQQHFPIQIEV